MIEFLSPTIDHFSPSQTCFLQIPAHCMYLSFGATLAQIGICYSTFWSVGGPAIINEGVLCVSARKMQSFAQDWCLHTFFFQDKGEDIAAQSASLWTLPLQLSRGGFSKLLDTATILQRAVTEQCTNSRLCVWPLHCIHCQPACPSATCRLPSLIQMFLMLVLKQKMMKSLANSGIHGLILKANNLY